MTSPAARPVTAGGRRVERNFLGAVVVATTAMFLATVRGYITAVVLAGAFAAILRPACLALSARIGNRIRVAAAITVLALALVIVAPLVVFISAVVAQAVEIAESTGPWISAHAADWNRIAVGIRSLPGADRLIPDDQTVVSWASQLAGHAGSTLVDYLRAATTGTLHAVLQAFVAFYALYHFLTGGPAILHRILSYAPMRESDAHRLVDQFASVTRATIKGSMLVALIQGGLAGAAFFFLGLPGAAFWMTVMAALSVIPMLGSGLVWAPAAVLLVATGRVGAGIGLALWGAFVVGTIDNFLRPVLVGRDTKLPDLLVLLATFGGLATFGLEGFIVGPIIAALFVTAWDLAGAAIPAPPARVSGE
jgi:predicted PurR-regulated permease PerM